MKNVQYAKDKNSSTAENISLQVGNLKLAVCVWTQPRSISPFVCDIVCVSFYLAERSANKQYGTVNLC
jgi:hypothetical protein